MGSDCLICATFAQQRLLNALAPESNHVARVWHIQDSQSHIMAGKVRETFQAITPSFDSGGHPGKAFPVYLLETKDMSCEGKRLPSENKRHVVLKKRVACKSTPHPSGESSQNLAICSLVSSPPAPTGGRSKCCRRAKRGHFESPLANVRRV